MDAKELMDYNNALQQIKDQKLEIEKLKTENQQWKDNFRILVEMQEVAKSPNNLFNQAHF